MSTNNHRARASQPPVRDARRHLSIRLRPSLLQELGQKAAATSQPRNALIERLIDEGIQMEDHPQIYFRDGALGRRPALRGTRLDVWKVVETLRNHDNSVEDTAEYLSLTPGQVRSVVSYYSAHLAAVDEFAHRAIETADRAEERWRREQEVVRAP